MREIFKYLRTDDAGYRRILEVRPGLELDRLAFDTAPHSSEPAAVLPKDSVRELRDALTAWLGDGETGVTVRVHLTDKRILEIIRDELASRIPVPARPLPSSPLTEETPESIWGRPCATCGHTTSVHFHDQGCEHPDGCECAWPDTSAPAPEKCEGCTQRSHPHVFAKCSNCECTDTVGAPEPASAPECECGHPKSAHSGAPQHCTAWMNDNTVCPCEGYER